jgi:hypothetical protein
MSEDSIFPCVLACLLFTAVGFAVGTCVGFDRSHENFQREAIKKGHATWVADKDGNSIFQWKEASK